MKKPIKNPKPHKRVPRAKRSRRRKNPAFGLDMSEIMESSIGNLMVTAALQGTTFMEKTLVAAVMPGVLALIGGGGKFSPENHWKAFQPHCPQIAGVLCPPDCKHHGEFRFDGCHVCGCLHGGKKEEG